MRGFKKLAAILMLLSFIFTAVSPAMAVESTWKSTNSTDGSGIYVDNGSSNIASGTKSTAMGDSTTASGEASTAMGERTTASGEASTAMGINTIASAIKSVAMGDGANASGPIALATGYYTCATGAVSMTMGDSTTASGSFSVAMGHSSKAVGNASFAGGGSTSDAGGEAYGRSSFAFGIGAVAGDASDLDKGKNAISMGFYTNAIGDYSVAMGFKTKSNGNYSVAMGSNTTAGGYAFAMGSGANAMGVASVAMGQGAQAYGNSSVAMGFGTNASAVSSVALGALTTAGGLASFAGGYGSNAYGNYSFAFGEGAVAGVEGQAADYAGTIAFGSGAQATHANSVALGNNAVTKDAANISSATIGTKTYNFTGGSAAEGVVSVGDEGHLKQIVNVANGAIESGSTDAVNGGQIFDIISNLPSGGGGEDANAVHYNADKSKIELLGSNGTTISNVKAAELAEGGTYAATTGQLYAEQTRAQAVERHLQSEINANSQEIREVGAISAALAGLHFVEPSGEEGDKFVGAVAYGNYRGESAGAIGVAYKPSPNFMLSASTSVGQNQNAYNAGVSLKFGKGETAKTKAELQKQVKYLNDKNSALENTVAKQEERIKALEEIVNSMIKK